MNIETYGNSPLEIHCEGRRILSLALEIRLPVVFVTISSVFRYSQNYRSARAPAVDNSSYLFSLRL